MLKSLYISKSTFRIIIFGDEPIDETGIKYKKKNVKENTANSESIVFDSFEIRGGSVLIPKITT